MTVPPHSIPPRAASVEGSLYSERNSFLYLLLGLISVSERVSRLVPGIPADGTMPDTKEPPPPPEIRGGLFR